MREKFFSVFRELVIIGHEAGDSLIVVNHVADVNTGKTSEQLTGHCDQVGVGQKVLALSGGCHHLDTS